MGAGLDLRVWCVGFRVWGVGIGVVPRDAVALGEHEGRVLLGAEWLGCRA